MKGLYMNAAVLRNGVSVKDAAAQLGVRPETIYDWIRRGQLGAWRVGPRRLLVEPEFLADVVVKVGKAGDDCSEGVNE